MYQDQSFTSIDWQQFSNARLAEIIEKQKVIYGQDERNLDSENKKRLIAFKARLSLMSI
jgi:hypothetical protein